MGNAMLDDWQQAILRESMQIVATARHIDELLTWFTRAVVYRFGLRAAQIWAQQVDLGGQLSTELRSMAYQSASLPSSILVNTQMAALAERLLNQQSPPETLSIDLLFSQPHILLLRRHGLLYCASFFLSSPLLLPPPATTGAAVGKVPTPVAMVMLLFSRRLPPQELVPGLCHLLEQVLPVAGNRGLLLPAPAPPSGEPLSTLPAKPQQQQSLPTLSSFIPRRTGDAANGAFAAIADRRALRLYAAINGSRTVGELARLMQLDIKDVARALRLLLAEQRIQLYKPDGQLADSSVALDEQDL